MLRLQGSNTIDDHLGPALAMGLLAQRGLTEISLGETGMDNERFVRAKSSEGQYVRIEIGAHGSSTGFAALAAGQADLVAASRPISEEETAQLAAIDNPPGLPEEQVIGLDGVTVIVHPGNATKALTVEQLSNIFSGRTKRWEDLGTGVGPIHLYARDDRSGTYETFREKVLVPSGLSLAPAAQRLESSEALSDEVSQDPQGIGFIGLPYVRSAQALAIAEHGTQALPATADLIATEDYPLSRRLYFYLATGRPNPWARALMEFAQSPAGQAIVAREGFVPLTVREIAAAPRQQAPIAYQRLAHESERLNVNFRFTQGSAALDTKAVADLDRIAAYMKAPLRENRALTLAGFADSKDDPDRALLLSRLRALAVKRELNRRGLEDVNVVGLGEQLPVATNGVDAGRLRNRRVEVWITKPGA